MTMTKTKIAALVMLVAWPIAMLYGKTFGGMLHVAFVFTQLMWFSEWQATVPEKKGARRRRQQF